MVSELNRSIFELKRFVFDLVIFIHDKVNRDKFKGAKKRDKLIKLTQNAFWDQILFVQLLAVIGYQLIRL